MRSRAPALVVLVGTVVLLLTPTARAESFTDPAPPDVAQLERIDAPQPKASPELTFHAAPKPLPAGAVTQDWPQFLGPDHNNVSRETKLATAFDAKGPPRVWEYEKGSGYSAPVMAGDRLVLFHRVTEKVGENEEGREVVDCLHPETGQRYWRHAYATNYTDRYGYSDGPRGTPAIAPDLDAVYTYGAEGKLHCLELSTGRVRWRRDVLKEFKLKQNFFGVGSSPLLEKGLVIVNVGAEPNGPCVAAFDAKSGKLVWGAGKAWGPSYATPVPATFHGQRRVLVFAGGETKFGDAPSGGLLGIDPADGRVAFSFPWRGKPRESVNASSPLVLGVDRIFISESYGAGGVMLRVKANDRLETLWENDAFGTHFMSAVERDGHLYGVDGHGPRDAFLVCVDATSGKEKWRAHPEWAETVEGRGGVARTLSVGTDRCWLTPVDEGARFLCLGEWGHLLWVEMTPQSHKITSRSWLFSAGETWTPPIIFRGLAYVCQNTSAGPRETAPRLFCFDLRSPNDK